MHWRRHGHLDDHREGLGSEDPKRIVACGYDRCGLRYSEARKADPSPELELLLEELAPGAQVLDIGCGSGVPVSAAIARVANVTGVDISPAQVERARERVPEARFVCADIMETSFEDGSFDAVVAFYALFHLPRDEHRPLLERIRRWLRPGGHLLATVANSDHAGYTEPDFFGATMYWSHFRADWYERTLVELGFELLRTGIVGHGYRDVPGLPPERHPVVFARVVPAPV